MSSPKPRWDKHWSVGLRVWIQRQGEAVLGEGRADLLTAIDRCHSIRTAARELGISYRHAWLMVQAVNEAAGRPIVEAATGGRHGGGTHLTEWGHNVLAVYRQLDVELHTAAAAALPRVLNVPPDQSSCVHLAAAISLQEVVGQLLADYALKRPTSPVHAVFGASNELADYVLAGAPVDLFLSGDAAHLDRLKAAGKTSAGTPTVLAHNGLAIVATGKSPSIRKPGDLLRDDVPRVALAAVATPLGKCSQRYLEGLGIYDGVCKKAVVVDNSRAVLAALRADRATVGLAFSSDAATADDIQTVLRIPAPKASVEYAAAILAEGARRAEAQELLDFLVSPLAQRRFRRCGLRTA